MGDRATSRHAGDPEREPIRFDPYVAAAVLRKLSELAPREPTNRLMDPGEPLFVSAVGVLGDAKAWLDDYRTPFDYFAGDLLLVASRDRLLLVSADTFATTLASAALELVTVARLIELRDVRARRSGQGSTSSVDQKNAQPSPSLTDGGKKRFP
jgi:hypothetical protein